VNTADGSPGPDLGLDYYNVTGLGYKSGKLYIAGQFYHADGQMRVGLAAFDVSGVTPTLLPFNANISDSFGLPSRVMPSDNGSGVFVDGSYLAVNSVTRNHLAAIDAESGHILPSFTTGTDGPVYSLYKDGDDLYVGGEFSTIGGAAHADIARISATDGTVNSQFSPTLDGPVYAMTKIGNRIYAGGGFTTANGYSRRYAAGLKISDGSLGAWSPNLSDTVGAIRVIDQRLYIAGPYVPLEHP
jgi:hypothetical protein